MKSCDWVFENPNGSIVHVFTLYAKNSSLAAILLSPSHFSVFGVTYPVQQSKIVNYDWAKWRLRPLSTDFYTFYIYIFFFHPDWSCQRPQLIVFNIVLCHWELYWLFVFYLLSDYPVENRFSKSSILLFLQMKKFGEACTNCWLF